MSDSTIKLGKKKHSIAFVIYIIAAIITGFSCVLFMKMFEFALSKRIDFSTYGRWCWLITPVVFLICVELVRRWAPFAAGTGIPQTIFAVENMNANNEKKLAPLLSPQTIIIKIATLLLAVAVGASTGREGPTVQIAASIFLLVLCFFRRWIGFNFDFRSAVVAGGAAGLAAAFNTPLAGVTFAIEELTPDIFSNVKDFVLIAIIVAALAAQFLTGDYTYFGKAVNPAHISLATILIVGAVCGISGAAFSTAILKGQQFLAPYHRHRVGRYVLPIIFALGLLLTAMIGGVAVLGPGNQVAQGLLSDKFDASIRFFPIQKIASTLFTYWSGIAGGIFAPCLSIGASLGADIGNGLGASIASCALIGMAAFLAATIQAPMTAFVIIFEMTGDHQMLLPIMLASLVAVIVARISGAKHLYKALSENYRPLLPHS